MPATLVHPVDSCTRRTAVRTTSSALSAAAIRRAMSEASARRRARCSDSPRSRAPRSAAATCSATARISSSSWASNRSVDTSYSSSTAITTPSTRTGTIRPDSWLCSPVHLLIRSAGGWLDSRTIWPVANTWPDIPSVRGLRRPIGRPPAAVRTATSTCSSPSARTALTVVHPRVSNSAFTAACRVASMVSAPTIARATSRDNASRWARRSDCSRSRRALIAIASCSAIVSIVTSSQASNRCCSCVHAPTAATHSPSTLTGVTMADR